MELSGTWESLPFGESKKWFNTEKEKRHFD
jgi:hypothetical protein